VRAASRPWDFGVDVDGGECGGDQGTVLGVVEADHGDVAGHGETEVVQGGQGAQGDVVVEGRDGRHRLVRRAERLNGRGTGRSWPRHREGGLMA
jgi:hypothetical protein